MKSIVKRVLLGLVLIAILFVALNWSFFWANIKFLMNKPQPVEQTVIPSDETMEPNKLIIESLNITAPLIYVEETSEKVFQEALKNGVVHYPQTAKPGERGNAYYFGHSSDFSFVNGQYKSVFAVLPSIEKDAIIIISNDKGTVFRYKVIDAKVVSPKDLSVLDQGNNERYLLSLQTSYPIGTALKRFVVVAELVK